MGTPRRSTAAAISTMARRLLALAVSATALQGPHAKAPTAPLQATATAPAKTGPTWDDHVAIPEAPDTLVKGVDGNDSMRRKFEQMLREAQNKIPPPPFSRSQTSWRNVPSPSNSST